ncbi:uroporphyrinogen-III synthase [Paracoccus aminophilus]|uniref:Uroporphyrinogen-III synthase n=1 Tax=Paracoccus aminophilus JCM 7686 TaxID=1367847 RepID=S5XRF4_PARAH|nr:uroporphyrinogen-III synthase [Paracoccus aminophilus]AGT07652.1 uroporphyrinogen-III synthase [Paracoccus aminophilus JCM 7686]
MPLLLLTRPEPAARRFAAEAAGLGLDVVISPILRIVGLPHDATRIAAATGLVFTSENGVAFAGPGRGRPALCVGPRTAAAAQAAGYEAVAGPGDAARLLPMLQDLGPGWVHPHGRHVAKVLPVEGIAVYDQIAQPLNAEARAHLAGAEPICLPLFSPRSARLLSQEAEAARAPLWLAPISLAAAKAWQGPAARQVLAETPDAAGILGALGALLRSEHS